MPKMIIHAPAGTFVATDRQCIAGKLTTLGLACEGLPASPFVRSTVWIYFSEYQADAVYMGTQPAWVPVVTLQIYVLTGGLDSDGKRKLIEGATAILDRRPNGSDLAPVYVVINEIPEENWGIFGQQADLTALKASARQAEAPWSDYLLGQ